MKQMTKDTINNYGTLFRFITPLLIGIVGYFLITGIGDLKIKLRDMDSHFTNHLNHHQDLEVGYERRLSVIETKQTRREQ